ncbi:hypothetical protein PFISCL1PPCAC_17051, partial [Pristionchus fissidentatus]
LQEMINANPSLREELDRDPSLLQMMLEQLQHLPQNDNFSLNAMLKPGLNPLVGFPLSLPSSIFPTAPSIPGPSSMARSLPYLPPTMVPSTLSTARTDHSVLGPRHERRNTGLQQGTESV